MADEKEEGEIDKITKERGNPGFTAMTPEQLKATATKGGKQSYQLGSAIRGGGIRKNRRLTSSKQKHK